MISEGTLASFDSRLWIETVDNCKVDYNYSKTAVVLPVKMQNLILFILLKNLTGLLMITHGLSIDQV